MNKQSYVVRLLSIRLPALLLAMLMCGVGAGHAQVVGMGDIPLDRETYERYLQTWPDHFIQALPTRYDARDAGLVSSPKNQGACGSCWAFASVGAFESHLLKQFGGGASDLSEQQLVSCYTASSGCCGGSSSALRYWESEGPIQESCGPYVESSTSCPIQRTQSCPSLIGCDQLTQRVENWHTIPNDPEQMKSSLHNHGPSYWRYDVYSDFQTFWSAAAADTVYRHTGGDYLGGHAVLLIGWDDTKQAYLCKNSWGATGGPQRDGTFWIAYSGHANDLRFQMANFQLTQGGSSEDWGDAYRALTNDPSEIETLRRLRDQVVRARPEGRMLTEILYRHADDALAVLNQQPALLRQAADLVTRHRDAVADVLDGKFGVLHESREIVAFLRRFGRQSPPMLKLLTAAIIEEMIAKQDSGEPYYGFYLD
ncbi:MAG: hypothetical protein KFB96_20260 [Thiocapsa sp.]|uniref:C1 family peptidase n=1 Tax=Thiocapsa sp. TaxID=2024551 RepID=UPI001BCE20A7|nr:C1 family peptidase [Thiocapsa sp.]QVL47963.1 MAG: hypothetical protein KFB96_20260 [Thiocapsa sp.]